MRPDTPPPNPPEAADQPPEPPARTSRQDDPACGDLDPDRELDPCVIQRVLSILSERGYGPGQSPEGTGTALFADGVTVGAIFDLARSRGARPLALRFHRNTPLPEIPAFPFLLFFRDRSGAIVDRIDPAPGEGSPVFLIREERDDGTVSPDTPLALEWSDLEPLWDGDAAFFL